MIEERRHFVHYVIRPVKQENWDEVMDAWNRNEITAKEAMKLLKLKKSTFYRMLKEK